MTLLPFVMTMILVLSLYATSLFKTHTHFAFEKEIYLAQYDGDIALRNELVKTEYKLKSSRVRQKNPKTKKPQVFIRPTENFPDRSKINLSHLNNPLIFKTACTLVKRLYKDAPFEIQPSRLFKEVKEKMKTTDDFAALFPYKLVKGTSGNYPPISDYFYINPKREAIHFRHASKPVISAYFGEKIAQKIFALEKTSTLTEEELNPLTSKKEGLSFKIVLDKRSKESYKTPLTQVVRQKKSK